MGRGEARDESRGLLRFVARGFRACGRPRDPRYTGRFLSPFFAPFASQHLRRVLSPAAVACVLAFACSPDAPPDGPGGAGATGGISGTGGAGGAMGGSAGASVGGT